MKSLLPDEILLLPKIKEMKCGYCNYKMELPIEIVKTTNYVYE